MSNWVNDNILSFTLLEFTDQESGIDKYITFVGSSRYRTDVLPESEHDSKVVELNLGNGDVLDGHTYYLGAKVRQMGRSKTYKVTCDPISLCVLIVYAVRMKLGP